MIHCCVCDLAVCVSERHEATLRRTGERFWCPAGHSQSFEPQPTKDQRRIAQLERQLDNWQGYCVRADERTAAARLLARTCPLCGWVAPRTRRHLIDHLLEEHGAALPAEERAA